MMLGQAALAMWWNMDADVRGEFEHWHSHEHFPERLALPGFQRASRWAEAGDGLGFFVLYELATYEALVSPEYQARLNAPSDWSRKMMPHHRQMVRSQCRVLDSRGSVVAGQAITVRLSPEPGQEQRLRHELRALVQALPERPGLVGAHLLQTDTPTLAPTTEQRIRGLADRAADWVFIAIGYDAQVLRRLGDTDLSATALQDAGAAAGAIVAAYTLSASLTAAEAHPSTNASG
jgi:quinol monooxygenase YgiN